MKTFKLTRDFMDKMAQLKLEEQALQVATLVLDHIEFELNKDMPDMFKVKELSKTYSTLKPYF